MSEKIIQLNEGAIKQELSELVRESVEKTLNELLDQEADRFIRACEKFSVKAFCDRIKTQEAYYYG